MELIACIGLMWIIKNGSILDVPREYLKSVSETVKDLLECSLCLGFWIGLIPLYAHYKDSGPDVGLIYWPFASSAVCWFADSLLDLIQETSVNISK